MKWRGINPVLNENHIYQAVKSQLCLWESNHPRVSSTSVVVLYSDSHSKSKVSTRSVDPKLASLYHFYAYVFILQE
jgi:hypothetical protein